jgi:hypothetical protein
MWIGDYNLFYYGIIFFCFLRWFAWDIGHLDLWDLGGYWICVDFCVFFMIRCVSLPLARDLVFLCGCCSDSLCCAVNVPVAVEISLMCCDVTSSPVLYLVHLCVTVTLELALVLCCECSFLWLWNSLCLSVGVVRTLERSLLLLHFSNAHTLNTKLNFKLFSNIDSIIVLSNNLYDQFPLWWFSIINSKPIYIDYYQTLDYFFFPTISFFFFYRRQIIDISFVKFFLHLHRFYLCSFSDTYIFIFDLFFGYLFFGNKFDYGLLWLEEIDYVGWTYDLIQNYFFELMRLFFFFLLTMLMFWSFFFGVIII